MHPGAVENTTAPGNPRPSGRYIVLRKSVLALIPALLALSIATAAAMTPGKAQLIAELAADGGHLAEYLRGEIETE